MSTFDSLVDEVLSNLRSYVRDQEQSTHLTEVLAVDGGTLSVDDASVLSRGRVEIGDEVIWLSNIDRGAATATIPPYGRGFDSTTAAAHAIGDRVVSAPLYPRHMVKKILNDTIKQMGQSLYAVAEEVVTPSAAVSYTFYEMPADTRDVLSVRVTDTSGTRKWQEHLRRWQLDHNTPAEFSTTGKAVYIYDPITSPCFISVTYSKDPAPLVNGSDDFTVTGFPASSEDVLVLLASSRLLATADAYAVSTRAIEANQLDSKIQPGQAAAQSKYLLALGMQRLSEERLRLLNETANRSHYNR